MSDSAASRPDLQAGAPLGSASELEGRAYLQQRLELISKLMFWSFATLIAFLLLMYWATPVDLYALGAVGYFLVTGKKVFDGKTPLEICVQHVTGTVISPSQARGDQVPAELEQLLLDLLAKAPDKRPTATALVKRLRTLERASDWSEEAAETWWTALRAKIKAVDTSSPTQTIKVDLDRVAAEPPAS